MIYYDDHNYNYNIYTVLSFLIMIKTEKHFNYIFIILIFPSLVIYYFTKAAVNFPSGIIVLSKINKKCIDIVLASQTVDGIWFHHNVTVETL